MAVWLLLIPGHLHRWFSHVCLGFFWCQPLWMAHEAATALSVNFWLNSPFLSRMQDITPTCTNVNRVNRLFFMLLLESSGESISKARTHAEWQNKGLTMPVLPEDRFLKLAMAQTAEFSRHSPGYPPHVLLATISKLTRATRENKFHKG